MGHTVTYGIERVMRMWVSVHVTARACHLECGSRADASPSVCDEQQRDGFGVGEGEVGGGGDDATNHCGPHRACKG